MHPMHITGLGVPWSTSTTDTTETRPKCTGNYIVRCPDFRGLLCFPFTVYSCTIDWQVYYTVSSQS